MYPMEQNWQIEEMTKLKDSFCKGRWLISALILKGDFDSLSIEFAKSKAKKLVICCFWEIKSYKNPVPEPRSMIFEELFR